MRCFKGIIFYFKLKLRHFILFITPWLLAASLVWFHYKPVLQLWPTNRGVHTYSDSTTSDHGNSGIRIVSSDHQKLVYEYSLGDQFIYPYVGLSFNEDSLSDMLDLSDYDYLEIDFEANLSQRIPVVLNQNVKGFSVRNQGATYRPLTQEMEYDPTKRIYRLPLDKFETPSWWYKTKNITESKVGKPDLSRIHYVQFHNCQMLPKEVVEISSIYSLAFHKDIEIWWWLAGFLLLLYYGMWFLISYFSKSPIKIFPRKELLMNNLADEESTKVLDYLAQHYSNPDLVLETIQKELGISETKISAILKETADMSFKRYLNHIRTEEAKRLLRETDRQVMDIAYKVGYGNVSHFNRVFKEAENCSPNEYRKNG